MSARYEKTQHSVRNVHERGGEADDPKESHRIKADGQLQSGCWKEGNTMTKQAYTMIAMIVLFGCLAVSAKAQCDMPLTANIPFQFSISHATLPAGEYKVTCFAPNGSLVLIRSTNGKAHALMQMVQVNGKWQDDGRLVFHRYGSRYFFVQAWAGGNTGLELPTTRAERTLERELAGLKPKTETVALKF